MSVEGQRWQSYATGELHPVLRLALTDGSATHPWVARLLGADGPCAMRDFADLSHFLCVLHGRKPGVFDHVAECAAGSAQEAQLAALAAAFAPERAFVTRVAVASGPAPSTPGGAQVEQAVGAQAHAIDMLSMSERQGCGIGAAVALLLDWAALRPLLERTAERCGVPVPPCRLPGERDAAALLDSVGDGRSTSRALLFGAEQLLAQQRGLLDLLKARADARRVADGF